MIKINEKNYYSKTNNKKYMSYSQFKDFCKCPAMAMAKIKGKWEQEETESLLVGSYVDNWLDGNLDKFVVQHPEMFTMKGELKAPFKKAEEICNIIEQDEYLYKILKGERQKILTGNIAGVPFKIKMDSLTEDMIVDGKVLKDCEDVWLDGKKQPFYMVNRYDIQAVIYKTIYKQNYGKDLPFILGVVTKEKVPDKRLIKINDNILEDAKNEIITKAPIFQAMKDGTEEIWSCGCCDYCKSVKKLSKNDIEEV